MGLLPLVILVISDTALFCEITSNSHKQQKNYLVKALCWYCVWIIVTLGMQLKGNEYLPSTSLSSNESLVKLDICNHNL